MIIVEFNVEHMQHASTMKLLTIQFVFALGDMLGMVLSVSHYKPLFGKVWKSFQHGLKLFKQFDSDMLLIETN